MELLGVVLLLVGTVLAGGETLGERVFLPIERASLRLLAKVPFVQPSGYGLKVEDYLANFLLMLVLFVIQGIGSYGLASFGFWLLQRAVSRPIVDVATISLSVISTLVVLVGVIWCFVVGCVAVAVVTIWIVIAAVHVCLLPLHMGAWARVRLGAPYAVALAGYVMLIAGAALVVLAVATKDESPGVNNQVIPESVVKGKSLN